MLFNLTKKRVISARTEKARTLFSRARGLMFRRNFIDPILFIFDEEKVQPIHSLFVFLSFDAVFLDREKRVTEVIREIAPFKPYIAPRKPAKYLIELPAGYAAKKKIELGDALDFSE
ncbi:MAG: DUF192 domain-containing protein [Candidatus Micrarchaeota archaeon]